MMYKAYRTALQALRREFQSGGDRYPGLFYEGLAATNAPFFPDNPLESAWLAFIAANQTKDERVWEDWDISFASNGCGRFYGDGSGVELFKRLAESLALVLCEMGEIEENNCDVFNCLNIMFEAASDYPTPLLRTNDRTWGVEDSSCLDKEALQALHEEMSEPVEEEPIYPVHPFCLYFVHDVFTSAVAFIDIILDPDSALLVGNVFKDGPPIYLKKPAGDNQGTTTDSVDQNQPTAEPLPTDDSKVVQTARLQEEHYMFKLIGNQWQLRYPGDKESWFPDWFGLAYFARLLMNPNRHMNGLEVEGIFDERLQISFGTDPIADDEAIEAVTRNREDVFERLEFEKKNTGDQMKIEELTNELEECDKYLKQSQGARGRKRPLGSPGDAEESRNRVGVYLPRTRKDIAKKMPLLAKHLKEFVTSVPLQGKWHYHPKELPHWVF